MNLQQLEQQYEDARAQARSTMERLQGSAQAEGRALGPGEQTAIQQALKTAVDLKARLDRARGEAMMTSQIGRRVDGLQTAHASLGPGSPFTGGGGLGAQFIASELGQWMVNSRGRFPAGAWTSPVQAELDMPGMMATTVDSSGGSGGPAIVPQYLPGLLPTPTRPLRLADLIASGTADSNAIVYLKELAWTNAAAATAEGAAKPESALTFTSVTEPVRKIATFLPVTEEAMEDIAAFASYLDQRLTLGVQLAEDDELLNGSGVAPHLNGFLVRAGLTAAQARGADSNADCVLKMIGKIQAAVFARPDAVVMHPTNWQTIILSKDANGRYYGDSPFGTSAASPLWGQPMIATPTPTLWGLPVAITPQIAVNTCLVGCFKSQAQLFRRGGLRVESTNSHLDFFQKNLIAIRSEQREVLAVYREAAFGICTGLS